MDTGESTTTKKYGINIFTKLGLQFIIEANDVNRGFSCWWIFMKRDVEKFVIVWLTKKLLRKYEYIIHL